MEREALSSPQTEVRGYDSGRFQLRLKSRDMEEWLVQSRLKSGDMGEWTFPPQIFAVIIIWITFGKFKSSEYGRKL